MKNILFLLLSLMCFSSFASSAEPLEGMNWRFLNASQAGSYDFQSRTLFFYNDIKKFDVSGSYSQIPSNLLFEDNLLYMLDSKNRLVVFDLEKEKTIKKIKIKEIPKAQSSGVAINEGYFYAAFEDGTLIAYSLLTETVVWQVNLITPINSAPLIDENKLFVVSNNIIYAIDAITGNTMWSVQGSKIGVSFKKLYIPVVYRGYLMVGLSSSDFMVVLKDNGELVWKKNLMGILGGRSSGTNPLLGDIKTEPLAFQDNVFVASNDKIALFSILNKSTLWQNSGVGSYSNAIKYKDDIILIDMFNNLKSFNIATGKESWNYSLLNSIKIKEKVFWNNILIVNNEAVLSNSIGNIVIYSLLENKVIKEFKLFSSSSEKLYYSPIVTDKGLIFLTSKGNLYLVK